MGSQEHNMLVLGQIVKHIPKKLIEKLMYSPTQFAHGERNGLRKSQLP